MSIAEEKHALSMQRGLEFKMDDGAKITEVEAFGQAQSQMMKEGHFVTGVGASETSLVSVTTHAEFDAKLAEVKASGAQDLVVATMQERPIHRIERNVFNDGTAVVGSSLDGPGGGKASDKAEEDTAAAAAAPQPKPTRKPSWQETRALNKAAKQKKRDTKKLETQAAKEAKNHGAGEDANGKRKPSWRRSRPPPPAGK